MSKAILSTLYRNRWLVPLKRSFSANVWSRHMNALWPSVTSIWSGSHPFVSPESDFTARSNSQAHLQETDNEWSHHLSFASIESDFPSRYTKQDLCQKAVRGLLPTRLWSDRLSFTSPESDFSAEWTTERHSSYPTHDDLPLFIGYPETAFGSIHLSEIVDEQLLQDLLQDKQLTSPDKDFLDQWKTEHLSTHPTNDDLPLSIYPTNDDLPLFIDHPETAFGSIHLSEIVQKQLLQDLQQEIYANPQDPSPIVVTTAQEPFSIVDVNDSWVGLCEYSLEESHPTNDDLPLSIYPTNDDLPLIIDHPETAFGSIHLSEIVHKQLLQDLQQEQQQQEEPLPVSLEEIYANPQDPRAIVVTTVQEPFFIVDVNDAWVGLCGYSREESRNHSLAKLLQGPETNQDKIHEFMRLLREGQEVSTVITNYTKEGRKFQNRVRAAPLRERGEITHFVGILQEIA